MMAFRANTVHITETMAAWGSLPALSASQGQSWDRLADQIHGPPLAHASVGWSTAALTA